MILAPEGATAFKMLQSSDRMGSTVASTCVVTDQGQSISLRLTFRCAFFVMGKVDGTNVARLDHPVRHRHHKCFLSNRP